MLLEFPPNGPTMRTHASLFLAAAVLVSVFGCRPDLDIVSPPPGEMLGADAPVEIVVAGVTRTVLVDALQGDAGEWVDGDESDEVRHHVPAHDGLGFVSVETERAPKSYAVRAWHQGQFLDPQEAQDNIATGRLDQPLLDAVTDLVGQSLVEVNLARYADNPVSMDAPVGTLSLDIVNATAEDVELVAQVDDEGVLHLIADLSDVRIEYQADHDSLSWLMNYGTASDPLYGVGTFDHVGIVSTVNLPALLCDPDPATPCQAGEFLENVVISHSDVEVDDSNCEFLWGWIDLCGLVASYFEDQLPPPLADAAEGSASHVLKHLVQSLDPTLDVQFEQPIQRDLFLSGVRTEHNSVVLEYSANISAIEPRVAREGHGVLARSMTTPGGSGICVGQPAINALGFAAWDAGNFANIEFDYDQLIAFGMPDRPPWDNIRKATVEKALPPLLEFREGSAWLDLGGIRAVVDTGAFGEAVLHAGGQVPVRIGVNDEGGLALFVNSSGDGARDIRLLGVGFEEAHPLLDRGAAIEIIEATVPGLMSGVLTDLANLTIAQIVIPPLDDPSSTSLTGHVVLATSDVEIVEDGWCVPATLKF